MNGERKDKLFVSRLYRSFSEIRSTRMVAEIKGDTDYRLSELRLAEKRTFLELHEQLEKEMNAHQRDKVRFLTLYYGYRIDYELTVFDWDAYGYVYLAPKKEASDSDRITINIYGSIVK